MLKLNSSGTVDKEVHFKSILKSSYIFLFLFPFSPFPFWPEEFTQKAPDGREICKAPEWSVVAFPGCRQHPHECVGVWGGERVENSRMLCRAQVQWGRRRRRRRGGSPAQPSLWFWRLSAARRVVVQRIRALAAWGGRSWVYVRGSPAHTVRVWAG